MDASEAVEARQIFDGLQVLVAGAADPFHPAAAGEGVGWAELGRCGRGRCGGSRGAAVRRISLLQGWGRPAGSDRSGSFTAQKGRNQ
jgi:hypothetical protein